MNYTLYLQKVSELVASMTPEQKDEWIMVQAVDQAAEAREAFLRSLSGELEKEEMKSILSWTGLFRGWGRMAETGQEKLLPRPAC